MGGRVCGTERAAGLLLLGVGELIRGVREHLLGIHKHLARFCKRYKNTYQYIIYKLIVDLSIFDFVEYEA